MVTIFRLGEAQPEFFASAPSMAEASAILPDGAYTTLRTYGNGTRVLRLAQHLARLGDPAGPGCDPRFEESKVRAGLVRVDSVADCIDRGFSRTVKIGHVRNAQMPRNLSLQFDRESLPAQNQTPQRGS